MKDILEEIIACKQKEIENLRQIVKEDILCDNCLAQRPRRSMRKALVSVPYGIIAEFKRKSPSKGWIKKEGRSDIIPPDYEKNGASALSILTDTSEVRYTILPQPVRLPKDLFYGKISSSMSTSSTRHASSEPTPYCLSQQPLPRKNAAHWQPKPTNWNWKSCWKSTGRKNSIT